MVIHKLSFHPPFLAGVHRRALLVVVASFLSISLLCTFLRAFGYTKANLVPSFHKSSPSIVAQMDSYLNTMALLTKYFQDYPLEGRDFDRMGQRMQLLNEWIAFAESRTQEEQEALWPYIEKAAYTMVPFVRQDEDQHAIRHLRQRFTHGSRGIVIPVGKNTFRFACHLLGNLRTVLHSELPIQIVYAGDDDLSKDQQQFLLSIGKDVELLDILSVFNDTTLDLARGKWAIKPFSILASRFQHTILMDSDSIFLQKPEQIFHEPGYRETGIQLYHDRLLWKGAFAYRHEWWKRQLRFTNLSSRLRKSKAYNEGYAEEGDSGVVAIDKARIGAFAGLLHICWQNTKAVREAWTYVMGHGDKESYWLGFELTATPYGMGPEYAAMLGTQETPVPDENTNRTCSFDIAHTDYRGILFWFNGSLLKNKKADAQTYAFPNNWMVGGIWEKPSDTKKPGCMSGTAIYDVPKDQADILQRTIDSAKDIDREIMHIASHPGSRLTTGVSK